MDKGYRGLERRKRPRLPFSAYALPSGAGGQAAKSFERGRREERTKLYRPPPHDTQYNSRHEGDEAGDDDAGQARDRALHGSTEASDSIKDYYEISTARKDIVEAEAAKCSSEAFLARLFVLMADNKRYKPLKDQLENDYLL